MHHAPFTLCFHDDQKGNVQGCNCTLHAMAAPAVVRCVMPHAGSRPVQIEQLEKSLGRQRGPTIDAGLERSQPGRGFADASGSSKDGSGSSKITGSDSGASAGSRDGGSAQAKRSAEAASSTDSTGQPGAADVISGIQQGKPWDTRCPNLLIKGVHLMMGTMHDAVAHK